MPYEEFWVPEFEIRHVNKFCENEGGRDKLQDIKIEGLGFNQAPSLKNPLLM